MNRYPVLANIKCSFRMRSSTSSGHFTNGAQAAIGPSVAPVFPGVIDVKITTETFDDRRIPQGTGKAWDEQSAGHAQSSVTKDHA